MSRILIIEDDPQVLELLARLLRRAGHEVETAVNGRDGIHAHRRWQAQLVVTDLIMPQQEGLETIVELRREHPDLPIIAISGGSREHRRDYLKAASLCGADRVFAKPFDNDELVRAVAEALEDG